MYKILICIFTTLIHIMQACAGTIKGQWTEGTEGALNIILGRLASYAFSCLDFSDF